MMSWQGQNLAAHRKKHDADIHKRARNNLNFHLDIEGKKIAELEHSKHLGIILSNTFSWDSHIKEVVEECRNRMNGLYKVNHHLDMKQKKNLAEGAIL